MQQPIQSENQFVVELLTTLRADGFSPRAWGRFLLRSWNMSLATAKQQPTLTRSWLRVTLLMGVLTLSILLATLFFAGVGATLRLLPGLLFCVTWQQSDLFWHLGLHRRSTSLPTEQASLYPSVGLANLFTWLRALGASYLLARIVGGLPTASDMALSVFLFGVVTDILDGQVARLSKTQSKLGQIADGEADFCLYLALTTILLQNNVLPLWLALVMVLRFVLPLLAALSSYFLFAQPVRFGSTVWGKYAGLAQSLYFFVLLAPSSLTFLTHVVNTPLLMMTIALLVIAPLAQIVANIRQ